jgi:hypothetical protein
VDERNVSDFEKAKMSQKIFLALAICLCVQQALGRPQGEGGQPEPEGEPEPEPGKASNVGNALQKVGALFDQHKGSILSQLGLSGGEQGGDSKTVLTTILEGLKLDNSTITTLISSVQNPEGFDKVKTAVLSGDMSSLSAVLKEQTGLDNTVITSTTNSIKEGITNLGKGTATSTKVGTLLVIFMALIAV